jgi:hypothetical protein
MVAEPGVRYGLANGAVVLALLGAGAARLRPDETAWVAVLVAGAASVGLPLLMTTSMGLTAWAFVTGFVVNRYGELTLARPDLFRLVVFAVSTLAVAGVLHQLLVVLRERAED